MATSNIFAYKDADGKEKVCGGRWADIVIKQGGAWMLIGDYAGQISKDNIYNLK